MKVTIGVRIIAAFGLSLAFVIARGVISYTSTTQLIELSHWVEHTHSVLNNLEGVSSGISEFERGLREYSPARDPRSVTTNLAAQKKVVRCLKEVRVLTADNQLQQKNLDLLEPLVESVLSANNPQTGKEETAVQARDLAEKVRSSVTEMQGIERTLLSQRDKESQSSETTAIYIGLFGTAIVALAVSAAGYLLYRSITRPLAAFRQFIVRVGDGDLTQRAVVSSTDELGDLAKSLNRMVENLKDVANGTREVAQHLNEATAEILASTKQQSASTSEQAAAVQQTNTTMQELSQSGVQISERAKQVATIAEATLTASSAGMEAVQNSTRTMETIREQAEAVAENVVMLSERTQAVGEIIATVNDIAEQSHLLSLNAAIEAAAAGEHGRTFSVVAAEIKNLADRSKEATVQVRSILGQIQKGINSSVMLAEESVRRVDSGKQQSDTAARTIRQLTESVDQSVQAFQQIVAGTNQQQIGFEQVALAIRDIGGASQQTASSVRQLEGASAHLTILGKQLGTAMERYRT
jgi:methyl-accepting chemotaxis protein